MVKLLRIDPLSLTDAQRNDLSRELCLTGQDVHSYAIWFFLDKEQSCFVQIDSPGRPLRKPEFLIKDIGQIMHLELFRERERNSNERILVGEARISAGFLLAVQDNHLLVEFSGPGDDRAMVATVLLHVEQFDQKGRSLSANASPTPSVSLSDFVEEQVSTDLSRSSSLLSVGQEREVEGESQKYDICSSVPDSPHKVDLVEKLTLSGSPISILKSQVADTVSRNSPPQEAPEPTSGGEGDKEVEAEMEIEMDGEREEEWKGEEEDGDEAEQEDEEEGEEQDCVIRIEEDKTKTNIINVPNHEKKNSSSAQVKGLVSLEIVAAQNLPREKRLFRVQYQNNPFVVISFGKQSFKTKVIKRTTNPVWKERLYFTVKGSEANYYIMFSIYDYEKLSYNMCIGSTNIKVSNFLEHPNEIQKVALSLKLATSNGFSDACLLIKGCFISYDVLRKNFWQVLAKQYDHDDNDKLNRIELATMLESIGSTLSEETLNSIFSKLDVEIDGEIAISNIVASLEDLTVRSSLPDHPEENIVLVRTCPICGKSLQSSRHDIDVITHLAICAAKDSGKLDRFVMGGFLTEDYASRKLFAKLLSFMSFGGYRIGKNNGNILVQDRRTGKLMEEKMPTYIRLGIRMLHQYSASNRAVDSYMVRQIFQALTIKQGRKFDDPSSARNIADFIRFHKIAVDEILEPISSFRTFNEFFYRKLKQSARKLASPDPRIAISPADCRLNCFQSVDAATRLWIKGANFSIANLLKDEALAEYYNGGSLIVCRLAPQDYHRFHSPVDGELTIFYHIPGTYFTVNPMAVRQRIDVYTENARTICMINSDHFGKVTFVAIGAMMVGSISITANGGQSLRRMDELGYFAFGGSTIVVLFPRGAIAYDADLLENSDEQLETLVQVGNSIGHASGSADAPV